MERDGQKWTDRPVRTDEERDGWGIYLLRWRGGLALRTSTGKILCELEGGMDRGMDGLRKGGMDREEEKQRSIWKAGLRERARASRRQTGLCVPEPKATAASIWQQLFIGDCCLYY